MLLARATESFDIRDMPPKDVIFGQSPGMSTAREKLERIAETTVPVLLQGESGTGKEIFAKLLHAYSNRSNRAWVKVTCAAIPHSLIESELFGYEMGAFTGAYATKRGRVELAHMGTLFLDEVCNLDMSVQAKLLEVLQDGNFTRVGAQESRRVDTRLVCAANEDLRQQTDDGSFRLDFFFRINAVEIDLANPISLKEITKAATRDLEREIILKVLQANGWNRQKTAKWLNISYRSLLYKLQESKVSVLPGRPLKDRSKY